MKINTMSIKEFREKGYLQELNRQFLHPLGLALEVYVDEEGNETLQNIWDYRKDSEGIYYNLECSSKQRIKEFRKKAKYVEKQWKSRFKKRRELLGFMIETIPED